MNITTTTDTTLAEAAGVTRAERIRADYDEYLHWGGRHSFTTWYQHYADNYPDIAERLVDVDVRAGLL